jgi:hypothetical protein
VLPYQEVAVAFAAALVAGDFGRARGLLTADLRTEPSERDLEERFTSMYRGYADSEPSRILFVPEGTLETWPEKQPGDLGWAYVSIEGDDFNEVVYVCQRPGWPAQVRAPAHREQDQGDGVGAPVATRPYPPATKSSPRTIPTSPASSPNGVASAFPTASIPLGTLAVGEERLVHLLDGPRGLHVAHTPARVPRAGVVPAAGVAVLPVHDRDAALADRALAERREEVLRLVAVVPAALAEEIRVRGHSGLHGVPEVVRQT